MKLALVSTGLGRVLRGFESFTASLFQALRQYAPQIDVTLFQGGGCAEERRVVIPSFHRSGIPARWFGPYRAGLLEQRSFALSLYPVLRKGNYNIVQYNELVMGSALFHLRRHLGGRFKLLYVNGAPSPPIHYHHRCDFAQLLTGPAHDQAREFGLPDERLFLVPYGIDANRFSPETQALRAHVRRELEIPERAVVVLTMAALKSEHKRIDYLVREISRVNAPIWLLAAGQRTPETSTLEREAQRLLHGRSRFVTWPHEKVHMLYGGADVFVLGSLTEAFGIVTVEAMLSGLQVVVHRNKVNEWITAGTQVKLVDMSLGGQLAAAISTSLYSTAHHSDRTIAKKRFSWEELIAKYVNVYHRITRDQEETSVEPDAFSLPKDWNIGQRESTDSAKSVSK